MGHKMAVMGCGTAQALVVTQQAGATYTFALADEGTVVESTYATGATFTIPLNSSVAFGVPTEITAEFGNTKVI